MSPRPRELLVKEHSSWPATLTHVARLCGSRSSCGGPSMPPLACMASQRLPRAPGEPQAGGEPLLYALQLVNRLGSKRSRAELLMQSPVLQARDQHRAERLAAVEGECFRVQPSLSCTGRGRARRGRTLSPSRQSTLPGGGNAHLEEGTRDGGKRWRPVPDWSRICGGQRRVGCEPEPGKG